MTDLDMLKSLVDSALAASKARSDAAIARCRAYTGSQIRFSQSSIDIAQRWEELSLDLVLVVDKEKVAIGRTPVASTDDVKKAVDDMVDVAKRLPASALFAGLEDRPGKFPAMTGNYDGKIDGFAVKAPQMVGAAIDAALQEGAKRVAGALKFSKESFYMRSSLGPEGSHRSTAYDLNVRAFQEELDYSGQGLSCGTKPSADEKAMVAAGRQAGSLSRESIGAKQGEPGTYDLVLSPTVAADFIAFMPGAANPFLVMIGLSPLGDRIGATLAPEFVSASDDALFKGGIGSQPFDFEGTPARTVPIIDRGVLKSFVHNTTTAKMSGTESTGNSAVVAVGLGANMLLPSSTNVVFDNGTHTLEELLEGNKPTIYVTCNWYTRFQNYVTGDFSTIPRDAMFLVKNGKRTPIKNVRISDNTLRMFANITAMGKDRKQILWWEVQTPTVIPSVKVADCRITAATQ